jgi:putative FmdB family regulatory protein
MPHYEYECTQCGHRFEVFQRMTDAKLEVCPECGGRVERLIGPGAGIVFKGSGFYQTDYRSESYKKAAKSEGGTGSKSEDPTPPANPGGDQGAAKPAKPAKEAPAKPAESGSSGASPAPKPPKPGSKPQA